MNEGRLRMRVACWLPMHCPSSKLHFHAGYQSRSSFTRTLPEALWDRPFKLSTEAKRVFVAYQIEEDGAPSDWGHDKNNAQIHATLDEL